MNSIPLSAFTAIHSESFCNEISRPQLAKRFLALPLRFWDPEAPFIFIFLVYAWLSLLSSWRAVFFFFCVRLLQLPHDVYPHTKLLHVDCRCINAWLLCVHNVCMTTFGSCLFEIIIHFSAFQRMWWTAAQLQSHHKKCILMPGVRGVGGC